MSQRTIPFSQFGYFLEGFPVASVVHPDIVVVAPFGRCFAARRE
jgi:hypothetical protein